MKVGELDAPGFVAMAYPETGQKELLTLAKLLAWARSVIPRLANIY